jgi:hypothetical protein
MCVGSGGACGDKGHGTVPAVYGRNAGRGPARDPGSMSVGTRVVVKFWRRLQGFEALGLPRKGWGQVGPRYPFLRGLAGELHCSRPERLDGDG